MTGIDVLARQITWCGNNMAHNLDFIPDEKLNWKPGPDANSALEVVYHTAGAISGLSALMDGSAPAEIAPLGTRDDARAALLGAVETYVSKLQNLTAADLGRTVTGTPLGDLPMGQLINMPVVDAIHHHGQIAYIQTLLGDKESHFVEPDF